MLILYADGASRGNPGEASLGAVLFQNGIELARISERLGVRTNNYAEYSAVIAGIKFVVEHDLGPDLLIRMDSKLVVEQLSGRWKINHPELKELAAEAQRYLRQLNAKLEWIPREQNALADEAANQALDGSGATEVSEPTAIAKVQPSSIRAPRVQTEPTVVYLVRHGHTASTESALISGSSDNPPLSELGRIEAKAAGSAVSDLAERFGLPSPELVVHSDLVRTQETAEQMSKSLSKPARPDSRLREISFGDWERVSMSELESYSPQEVAAWRGSVSKKPPGGESILELEARVLRSLDDLINEFRGGAVVLVAHMMPLRAIAKRALGAPESAHWSLQFAPGSVSVLRFFGTELTEVFALNSCEHLPQG